MFKKAFIMLALGLSAVIDVMKPQAVVEPWDRLLVTWGKFEGLPLTAADAMKQGWTKDACCGDPNNQFYGNRYVKGNDTSTRLLYDNSGGLAGIQATITGDDNLILSGKPRPSIYIPDDKGNFLLTAYFSHPLGLCREAKRSVRADKEEEVVPNYDKVEDDQVLNRERSARNLLWFQMSDRRCKPRFMKIPLFEKHLADKWVKGKCMRTMGVHYWYDATLDMDCTQFFPIFLLYSKQNQQLQAFGWAVPAAIKSPRWEHPPTQYLSMFFEVVPKCLASLDMPRSTQHIYRSDDTKLTC